MDFLTMMQTRKSCRAYQNKPVSREDLLKVVEAGRLSPSGCNAQPWKFIVVDEAEALEKVRDALVVEDGMTGAPWRGQVPAFIVFCEQEAKVRPSVLAHYKDSQRFAQGDIGAACMNMCHQAMDMGLSTCIIGLHDQKKMEQHFGLAENDIVRLVLAVGYNAHPDKPPRAKVRKPFDEIVCFNSWK